MGVSRLSMHRLRWRDPAVPRVEVERVLDFPHQGRLPVFSLFP